MKEAKRKLEEKIRKLEYELKRELPQALMKAIELGDLRENAEYQTAKERQAYVQAELAQLHSRLAKLSLIDLRKIPFDKISYGSTVLLRNLETNEEIAYTLVSSEESDVSKGMISTASPIGKTLMGHEEGDEVEIRTPRGISYCKVLTLKTLHQQDQENQP